MKTRSSRDTAEARERREAKVHELKARLDEQVKTLATSDGWLAWTRAAAAFRRYSVNNTLLILAQCPKATRVAGFKAWKKHGRSVVKGETGIAILAPYAVKDQEAAPGPDGKQPVKLLGFKVTYVFDVSQTEGEPLPEGPRVEHIPGEAPPGVWDAVAARITHHGYTIVRENPADGSEGRTEPGTRRVVVRDDVDDAHALLTLIHELAHIECGHVADVAEYRRHRGRAEVEAESVAYILAAAVGVDASRNSIPYVADWAGTTPDQVAATVAAAADAVNQAARRILDDFPPALTDTYDI